MGEHISILSIIFTNNNPYGYNSADLDPYNSADLGMGLLALVCWLCNHQCRWARPQSSVRLGLCVSCLFSFIIQSALRGFDSRIQQKERVRGREGCGESRGPWLMRAMMTDALDSEFVLHMFPVNHLSRSLTLYLCKVR